MYNELEEGGENVKVILLRDVPNIGKANEIKEVSDGYARNYLIPKGLAKPATEGEIKKLENEKAMKEHKEDLVRKKSEEILRQLQRKVHRIEVKAGAGGKLFGALTGVALAELLSQSAGTEIDKKWIEIEKPIKEVGLYDVKLRLPGGVRGTVKVEVIAGKGSEQG